MIYSTTGVTAVSVYSGIKNLTNWTIVIRGKSDRERTEQTISMTVTSSSDTRYYLEWICPVLDTVEYSYEILSGIQTIDKGILRYGTI